MTENPFVVSDWSLFAHPLFLDQLEALIAQTERLRDKDPANYVKKNAAKRLAAVAALAFTIIPQDPSRIEYRLGNALGSTYKHWFRAKFFQQYRLFFRYHQNSKIIVYAWVNDETAKRSYESVDDAYRVFQRMLGTRKPPDDWEALVAEAGKNAARFHKMTTRLKRFPQS